MKRYVLSSGVYLAPIFLLGIISMALGGCTTKARIPVTGFEVPIPNIPLPAMLRTENDLRSRTWTKAFDILHARISTEYAFTERKGIDWAALYAVASAEVAAAESNKDPDAWYLALRRYLFSIPDGNIQFDPNDYLRVEAEGAGAGLALTQLADGTVIVCGVSSGTAAQEAGIQWGAAVFEWNGKPIAEALAETSLLWSDVPPATPNGRLLQQLAWLPRGHAGETCTVTYKNPDAAEAVTTELSFELDDFATLTLSRPLFRPVELFSSPIESRALTGGYRYIRIAAMAPTLSTPFPVRDFRAAVKLAVDSKARGVILDLRGTQGGDVTLPPKFLSSFVSETTFYETPAVWDSELETFLVETEETVNVEPQLPAYLGPIVILVNAYTMGPAESFALFLQKRDNVKVYGDAAAYGSPGNPTRDITLPGGYVVYFPDHRSLNEDGEIQGTADASGNGVVAPDDLFVIDRVNGPSIFLDHKDAILDKAVEMLDSSTWRFP